jgi:hypothetical protein
MMKYFKHMSIMSDDTRLKRIKRKYGLAGYGLYNIILEYISRQLDKHSPLPDLQETAEDIADEWSCDVRDVNEMMLFMVNEELFETDYITGRIVCTKLEKYLDDYIKKVPEIHRAIDTFRVKQIQQLDSENVGETPTNSENVRFCPSRREENRKEENRIAEQTPLSDRYETNRQYWNKQDLPGYKYLAENCPDLRDIIPTLDTHDDQTIEQAIDNYVEIQESEEYELDPEYQSFIGFMRPGRGVDKYRDEAKPFERCAKDKRARAFPKFCKKCGATLIDGRCSHCEGDL